MSARQQRRAAARAKREAGMQPVTDSFQNMQARLGTGAGSIADANTYAQTNMVGRTPRVLEFMYRGSWVVGAAVDSVADDMVRAGVDFGSAVEPDALKLVDAAIEDLQVWQGLGDTIRWSRLYGGAIGVMLIDGQDMSTPLRQDTVTKDQFRGLLALDRWQVAPSQDKVTDLGPDLGQPISYQVVPGASALVGKTIHHSRVVRAEGVRLPWYQRQTEMGWGLSIVERMFDRLTAFDSATTGAAQLVFKAYLRVMKVKGLRQILAAGGAAEAALTKQVEGIRKFQTTEGLTLVDADDEFEALTYTFTGLDELLMQFGQQISGATEIPLVRLFGQSPAGLNSTGESDLRNYYDGINAKQNRSLKAPLTKVMDVLYRSATGAAPPDGFGFEFNPLWQLSDEQRALIAKTTEESVGGAYDRGLISKGAALRELKQSADVTGIFSNITDDEIEEADAEPPLPTEGEGGEGSDLTAAIAGLGPVGDSLATMVLHGLPLVIETPRGATRSGGEGADAWSVIMPDHYGYIDGTWSAEGQDEEMDCFIGPDATAERAWVIDQQDLKTGRFDEHKVMLGYPDEITAIATYIRAYHDRAAQRIIGITELSIPGLKAWLSTGDLAKPLGHADP